MDELYAQPEILEISQYMGTLKSKDFRAVQGRNNVINLLDLCQSDDYSQAEVVASNAKSMAVYSHLAEKYIEKADLNNAQKAFIKSGDYRGVQFIKKLEKITVNPESNFRIL